MMAPALRILLGVVGVAGILLGLFLIAVASFADGSTVERIVTIAIAVGIAVLGGVLLRISRSR
ncbi:MAG TPA: hypothetical protein VJ887_07265 [Actinomycetota bacterium]|nr:hypothetical protein [Actinomycetota bacterium]